MFLAIQVGSLEALRDMQQDKDPLFGVCRQRPSLTKEHRTDGSNKNRKQIKRL